ncbi:hypothetical protein [Algoriphagus confluentis]|uniref:Glycosyl transferase family 2 n=1 Tax=Algoriphagus confluentis TaxID=1697556 RepID=A0ABQ6PNN5_9BACT|nr:hypothetical protein Aconfl_22130 [Algoriphagus confluentis]
MSLFRNLQYYRFLFEKSTDLIYFPIKNNHILLLTVAYNNVEFVELQINLLRKYFKEDFIHCVVDNSTSLSVRNELKEICKSNWVLYYGVPKTPFSDHKSHGAAMHWAFVNVVRKIKPPIFGYLDHDIFPFKSFEISGKLFQGVYGRVVNSYIKGGGYMEERTKDVPYWSIWAGYCFFDFSLFKGLFPWHFNFLSKHFQKKYYLDTGGGLWDSVYSKTKYPGILATYRKLKIDELEGQGDQNGNFEIFDESLIHFVSLSNWRAISDIEKKKEILLATIHRLTELNSN